MWHFILSGGHVSYVFDLQHLLQGICTHCAGYDAMTDNIMGQENACQIVKSLVHHTALTKLDIGGANGEVCVIDFLSYIVKI
jgi:hypothetical protein